MKSFLLSAFVLLTIAACGQGDKSKKPSPPAQAKETLNSGTTITVDYSQPSIKGRTIGQDLEPKDGEVWRTGANEATVFETDKDLKVEGQALPAGKYGLFTLVNGDEWTIIFNKTWKQWGAFKYKEADDVLRVKVKAQTNATPAEQFTITVGKDGKISLLWGDRLVVFTVN